jgi:hypothetical protein
VKLLRGFLSLNAQDHCLTEKPRPARSGAVNNAPEIARIPLGRPAALERSTQNMPARSAIFVWLAKHKEFARNCMFARQIQIDCLLGDMLDIADACSKDWIEREGPDGKKFRVFDHENFRRSKRQMGALQWRISKLTPKRYHWMRWGPLRMP